MIRPMRWITRKTLEREFGLSPILAEQVIREQLAAPRRRNGARAATLVVLRTLGMLWVFFLAAMLFPSAHHGRLALLESPGLVLTAVGWLVLPRVLYADEIVAAARMRAGRGG